MFKEAVVFHAFFMRAARFFTRAADLFIRFSHVFHDIFHALPAPNPMREQSAPQTSLLLKCLGVLGLPQAVGPAKTQDPAIAKPNS